MSKTFRTTYRQDENTYVEDRGYAHTVAKGDAGYADLDAEFGKILKPGQTAIRENGGDGWEVRDGFPLLENLKVSYLANLKDAQLRAEANGKVESSVGFVIDATERANRDINGLITALKASGQEKANFCDADNKFHEVTVEQLEIMLLEIIQRGQQLYADKWRIRTAIENATTVAELEAIQIAL